jgi:hypothetical protein
MIQPPRHFWELLKTYYAGESVSSGTRRTLGTCPLLTANFTRSRRFLEAPFLERREIRPRSRFIEVPFARIVPIVPSPTRCIGCLW